jgi:hypothetical protein
MEALDQLRTDFPHHPRNPEAEKAILRDCQNPDCSERIDTLVAMIKTRRTPDYDLARWKAKRETPSRDLEFPSVRIEKENEMEPYYKGRSGDDLIPAARRPRRLDDEEEPVKRPATAQAVEIVNLDIPFGRMVFLFLKVFGAALVAGICLIPLWVLLLSAYYKLEGH